MTDIVERLRALSIDYSVQEGGFTDDGTMLREAADEIERLRAERKMGGGVTGKDKDMLISGFQHDLAKANAEIERLRALLLRHQTAAWHEDDSDLAVETRAALTLPINR